MWKPLAIQSGGTAAEQGLAEEEALKKGRAEKSREFTGSELYTKA